jgi:hypothetical protein
MKKSCAREETRDSIGQTLAQAGVNHELGNSELDTKLADIGRRNAENKAAAEPDELKRRRRPPLVPIEQFGGIGSAASRLESDRRPTQ